MSEKPKSESNHVFRGPCLLINHGDTGDNDGSKTTLSLFDVWNGHHLSRVSPETTNEHLHSCHGKWLALHGEWQLEDGSYKNDCSLLNVQTMEKVDLPPLEEDVFGILSFFLLSDSHVFIINEFGALFCCKIGSGGQFTKHVLYYDDELLCPKNAVIFQGKMYILAYEDQSYNLFWTEKHEDIHSSSQPIHLTKFTPREKIGDLLIFRGYRYTCLIESCDQLWLVDGYDVGPGSVDFEVFRADFENRCWEEVDNIGNDRVFFVDDHIGFSAITGSEVKGNRIYYVAVNYEKDEFGTSIRPGRS